MLLHNIYNSRDDRLIKKMIIEQEENDEEFTWYDVVAKYLSAIDMNPTMVRTLSKSELKKKVKEQLNKRMVSVIRQRKEHSSKMRFVSCEELKRKKYIINSEGNQTIETMKTRMNMLPVYGNYKNEVKLSVMCPYCSCQEDTTEHLLQCEAWGSSNFQDEDLCNEENVSMWTQINERIHLNFKWRSQRTS